MGRPNVGKSALFNRITGSGAAIVYDYPGVTRDCLYCRAEWGTSQFVMIDTGGLMNKSERLPKQLSPMNIRGLGDEDLPDVRPFADIPPYHPACLHGQAVMIDTGGLMNKSQRLPKQLSPLNIRGVGDEDLPDVCPFAIVYEPCLLVLSG